MPSFYNRQKAKALSERNRKRAQHRWKLDRLRRDAEEPQRLREIEESEILNFPRTEGDAVGCIQYHDFSTGKVTRWIVEIGDRADRRVLRAPDGRRSGSAGWPWLLRCIRMVILGNYQGLKRRRKDANPQEGVSLLGVCPPFLLPHPVLDNSPHFCNSPANDVRQRHSGYCSDEGSFVLSRAGEGGYGTP